jgi:2'-5' RNA ligase
VQHTNLYFIALVLPSNLGQRVTALKEEIRHRFNAQKALNAPPHITLQMPFKRELEDESLINETLMQFAARQQPIRIHLSGFGHFRHDVLFIKVDEHQPIIDLHASLNPVLKETLHFRDEEISLQLHPHVTIATRDLTQQAFNSAWPEFQKRPFKGSFKANSLCLLKHNGRFWEIMREFPFREE